jgi:glucokinase
MAKKNKKEREYLIGVDLGGTKVLVALINAKGRIVAEKKMPTEAEQGPEKVIARIAKTIKAVIKEADIAAKEIIAVGVGAPGPLNPETGIILNAPNLPGWREIPLAKMLEKETDLPTFIENDVNAGTFGEYKLGAGRGVKDIVGIFVGTGVGGGLIVGGKLRSGYRHVAAEVGHIIILADGPTCGCGNKGCLEALASRTAIVRDIMTAIGAGRRSVIAELSGGKAENVTSGVLLEAAKRRDALTLEVLGRAQYYLGILVANVVNFFDPEMVILGGGVVEAFGDEFLKPIRQTAHECFIAKHEMERVKIVSAELGDYAGVLGAAMLAAERAKKAARRKAK